MPWTTYLANKYLSTFRGSTYTPPSNLYFCLFTAMPSAGDGTGGIQGTEVTGNGYTRVAVSRSAAGNQFNVSAGVNADATPGQHLFNENAITFPRPTGSWGDVVAWGIADASTGGRLLMYEALPSPLPVTQNLRPYFAARALEFSIGGKCGAFLESKILNHLFRSTAWAAMSPRVLLGTATGTASSFPSEIGTPSTDGDSTPAPTTAYSRWPAGTGVWQVEANGLISNNGTWTIYIGSAMAFGGGQTTATHFAIIHDASSTFDDAPSANNMLWFGDLATGTVIPSSTGAVQSFTWPSGDFTIGFEL